MTTKTAQQSVVATGTGFSDEMYLDEREAGKDWTIFVRSSSWGNVDFQASDNKVDWGPLKDSSGALNFTGNGSFRVPGAIFLRMNVNSYAADITFVAR